MVSSVGEAFMKASEAIILYCILYIVYCSLELFKLQQLYTKI